MFARAKQRIEGRAGLTLPGFANYHITPVEADWISAVPLAATAALLLASPKSAIMLARGGFGAHLLDVSSIRMIESEGFDE